MKRIIGMVVAAGAIALAAAPAAHADEGHRGRDDGSWSQQYRRDDRGRGERDRRDRRDDDRDYRRGGEMAYRGDDCPPPTPPRRGRFAAIEMHNAGVDVNVGIGGWFFPRR